MIRNPFCFCFIPDVLIFLMPANVVISAAGRCPVAAGGAREETNLKNVTSVFAGLCLLDSRCAFCMVILLKAFRKNRMAQLTPHFWRLPLGILYVLAKVM